MVLYLFRNRTCVPSSGYDQEHTVGVFVARFCALLEMCMVFVFIFFIIHFKLIIISKVNVFVDFNGPHDIIYQSNLSHVVH